MKVRTSVLAASLALLLAACSGDEPASALPALPELATYTVPAAADSRGRSWDGVVEAVQQADLSAQTSGRVQAVNVDVNQQVAAGEILLRLTGVEQQAGAAAARAQVRAAEAAALEAEATYSRFAALAEKQLVSRLQLDQTRAARDAAVAARDAARAQLAQAGQQADYTVVRAPFAGVVSARHVEPGESVAPGQALLSVFAPGRLRIEVQVPQSEADAIRQANAARILLADGQSLEAAEVTVFPAADPHTHSIAVRVLLPAQAVAPAPGMAAKVLFPIGAGAGADNVRIPQGAVVQRGEISGAYVLQEGRLQLRQLRLGQRVGDSVEVLAGLRAGDVVATDPVAALQALTAQRERMAQSDE